MMVTCSTTNCFWGAVIGGQSDIWVSSPNRQWWTLRIQEAENANHSLGDVKRASGLLKVTVVSAFQHFTGTWRLLKVNGSFMSFSLTAFPSDCLKCRLGFKV